MRLLLDTSVLVAAMVEAHPNHTAALPWLQRAKGPEDTVLVAAHTIAELYAVLTTLPIRPSISPTAARELISRNISGSVEVVSLAGEDVTAQAWLPSIGTCGTFNAITCP